MAHPLGGASGPSSAQNDPAHNVIFGSVDKEILNKGKKPHTDIKQNGRQEEDNSDPQKGTEKPEEGPKISSTTCRPVAKERP